jgi:hypothetical protein
MVSRGEMNHEGAKSAKEGGFRERYFALVLII